MPICYYLPGLVGSALTSTTTGVQCWGSILSSTLIPLSTLDLAADGVTPAPPCGLGLTPTGLYDDYYGPALAAFSNSLYGENYTVIAYPFDFRLTLLSIGANLASAIASRITPDVPCAIVAHSAGGLVARAAWLALGQVGAQNLVRRIVTYGTPHQGSYGAVSLWSLDSTSLTQIQYLAILRAALAPFAQPNPCDPVIQSSIAGITTHWPALYDVLPLLGGSEAAGDPYRSRLFDSSNWLGPVTPSQPWLSYALATTQPWLTSPASLPPSWVLTSIAGTGVPTVGQLSLPQYLGSARAYSAGSDGDGTVTTGSALVEDSYQYTLAARHADLPLLLASTGILARAVLEVRTPPAPPPPPVTVPGPLVPLLGGPPVPSLGYPAGGSSPMRGC